jgi:glycerophosphoryl diester phosphodiesterase
MCCGHRRGVRILAHRGSPGTTSVENTVPAVHDCLEAGADGIEVDLRLSADGVLVVCHDPDLSRLTGADLPVATTPWADLWAAADLRAVPLARVEWVLTAAAGRRVVLEVKAPPPGLLRPTVDAVLDRLVVLRAASLPLDVTVSSFAPEVVAAVRALAPASLGLRTALLGRPTMRPSSLVTRALAAGHDEVHPHVAALLAEPGAVEIAHRCGLAVVPWTVNRSRAVRRLAALGVDAVITDSPVRARAALVASSRLAAA